jgi:ribonuclease P protein component
MRLAGSRDFVQIREQGERLARGCLIINWQGLPAGSASRVGIIASRKLGNAVTRSRARRLLRETFRLHQHELRQPVALVLVARKTIAGKKLAGVERDFLAALRQASIIRT